MSRTPLLASGAMRPSRGVHALVPGRRGPGLVHGPLLAGRGCRESGVAILITEKETLGVAMMVVRILEEVHTYLLPHCQLACSFAMTRGTNRPCRLSHFRAVHGFCRLLYYFEYSTTVEIVERGLPAMRCIET